MMASKNKPALSFFLGLLVFLAAGVVYAQPDLPAALDKNKTDTFSSPSSNKIKKGTFTGGFTVKEGGPVGGKVYFFDVLNGPPPNSRFSRVPDVAGEIGRDGKFSVEVPAGAYYIVGVKWSEGEMGWMDMKRRFHKFVGYEHKKGPKEYVIKEGGHLDVGVWEFVQATTLPATKDVAIIKGTITDTDGTPAANVVACAFETPQTAKKPLFESNISDKDGKYLLRVAKGTYYLRVRTNLGRLSPVDGQIKEPFENRDPVIVTVNEGDTKNVALKVGSFSGAVTAIQGIITDLDGKPAGNMVVGAFATPEKEKRPVFISSRSDKDGKYFLRVVKGTYYLRVRGYFGGGAPAVGESMDSYGEKDPVAVTVNDSEIKSINMKVEFYPGQGPFPEQGPKYGKGPKQDEVIRPNVDFRPGVEVEQPRAIQDLAPKQKSGYGPGAAPGATPGPPSPPGK